VPEGVALVSYEKQAELIEAERRKDDADIMDVISEGTPVREMIDAKHAEPLIDALGLRPLLDRAFRKLSTGETRKVMLIRALTSGPDLLVLDEPFDGLDHDSLGWLQDHIAKLALHTPVVMVLNRLDECPDFITHLAYVDGGAGEGGRLLHTIERDDEQAMAELDHLLHLKTTDLEIPPPDPASKLPPLDPDQPLVRMRKATVRYTDNLVFEDLDWTIERGEHWQVSGPNGSGKTCLLSLITGDHPQCYVNDIEVFGYRRGSGESIWDVKQYLGYVSTALQWEYRVGTGLRNVILSGFYDSIGLYTRATDVQKRIAGGWLELLGMADRPDQPFNKLSYGEQRLVLIARAMVKHPPLLILDEPCLGLDDMNRQLVLALIERICASDETTVLYVNHRLQDRIPGIENHLRLS